MNNNTDSLLVQDFLRKVDFDSSETILLDQNLDLHSSFACCFDVITQPICKLKILYSTRFLTSNKCPLKMFVACRASHFDMCVQLQKLSKAQIATPSFQDEKWCPLGNMN